MFGPKNDERRGSAIKSITAIARVLGRAARKHKAAILS